MKPEYIYEQRQAAEQMEAVMIGASIVGLFAAVMVFLYFGWLPGLCTLFLSVFAFAISRLFRLFSELFKCVQDLDRDADSKPPTGNIGQERV